jgi:hypothetical protein
MLMCRVGTRSPTASIHRFLEAQPAATKKRKVDSEHEDPRRRPARKPTDDYRGTSWNPATMYPVPMAYSNPMAYYPYRDLRGSNVHPWFNDRFGTFFRPELMTYNTVVPTTAADLAAASILACKFRVLDISRRVLQLTRSQRLLRLLRLLPLRYLRLLPPLHQRLLRVRVEA